MVPDLGPDVASWTALICASFKHPTHGSMFESQDYGWTLKAKTMAEHFSPETFALVSTSEKPNWFRKIKWLVMNKVKTKPKTCPRPLWMTDALLSVRLLPWSHLLVTLKFCPVKVGYLLTEVFGHIFHLASRTMKSPAWLPPDWRKSSEAKENRWGLS